MEMKKLDKALTVLEEAILVFTTLSPALVLFANVILRRFTMHAIVWAEEYARFAIMWAVFGGCGVAVRYGSHSRITALYDTLKGKTKLCMDVLLFLIFAIYAAYLVIYGFQYVQTTMANKTISAFMKIPMWIIYISVPFGGLSTLIRLAQNIVGTFRDYRAEKEA